MGFYRQEYWRRLPFSPPHFPNPGIKTVSPASPVWLVDSLQLSHLRRQLYGNLEFFPSDSNYLFLPLKVLVVKKESDPSFPALFVPTSWTTTHLLSHSIVLYHVEFCVMNSYTQPNYFATHPHVAPI